MDVTYEVISVTLYATSILFYVLLIPKISLTIPLKNLGTFLTTIVILIPPHFQLASQIKPKIVIATPIVNSQPVRGSNNTSRIPIPIPMKQTPKVFFNIQNNISPSSLHYYIMYSRFMLQNGV